MPLWVVIVLKVLNTAATIYLLFEIIRIIKKYKLNTLSMKLLYIATTLEIVTNVIDVWVDPALARNSFVDKIKPFVAHIALWCGLFQIQLVTMTTLETMLLLRDYFTVHKHQLKARLEIRKRRLIIANVILITLVLTVLVCVMLIAT